MKKRVFPVLCFLCAEFIFGWAVLPAPAFALDMEGSDAPKLEVIATIFPTYDFTRQVGGDKVNVSLLLPPGVEAHAFEPRTGDIIRINKSDLFIYTSEYMEPWVPGLVKALVNKGLTVVNASSGITFISGEEDEDGKRASHDKHHRGMDPHVWLDLANAQMMVRTIASALSQKDHSNSEFYMKNAAEYNAKLAGLDRKFEEMFSTARHRTIMYAGHFAFGYFAKRYSLNYVSPYKGFSPNAEPTPRAVAELIERVKREGIKCVYYEELLNPRLARVVSREAGAEIQLLSAAHNVSRAQLDQGVTFIDIMEDNMKKLKEGIECR